MTEKEINMVAWRNLDQLDAFHALQALEDQVVLKEVMLGDSGKERVEKYQVPMAEGLVYNFAAKKVNDRVLATLSDLAKEAQLTEKFQELYNGEIINTGEHRRVLHHLVRGQLGEDVCVDGVNKRAFYVEQQNKIADFAKKVPMKLVKNLQRLYRSVLAEVILAPVRSILVLKTGQRKPVTLRWKQNSSAMLTRMMRQQF